MRIVVTGGTSFIGAQMIEKLNGLGCDVFAVVRESNDKKEKLKKMEHVEVIEMDMEDYQRLPDTVLDIDCLVALAWSGTRGSDRNNIEKQKKNYEINLRMISGFLKNGCNTIVLAGSQAEYGNWCHQVISEEVECRPNTQYGIYKLKLFEEVKELCKTYNARVLEPRFFSVYGPNDYEDTMIMSCIKRLLKNEDVDVTAATQKWDYVYIDDAVDAVIELMRSNCPAGVYNVAGNDCRVLKEYIEEIRTIIAGKGKINYGAVSYPPTGPVGFIPSVKKIMKLTGWTPKTSFAKGIKNIINQMQ